MNCVRNTLLFFLFLSTLAPVRGQQPARLPGELLVSLLPPATPALLAERFAAEQPSVKLHPERKVATLLNIWLLKTGADEFSERTALEWLRRQPEVRAAQYNHLLEERFSPPELTPNDPLFASQWHHVNTGAGGGVANADFDSDLAWDITTGGLTPEGDTIVIAIIDGGIEYTHEDLSGNMWRNRHEIPGDSIDNDGNGYTDDFLGWNVYSQTDNINGLSTGHGTPVSALIGAKGNNGKGISGVNWNVKLMFVAGNSEESAILSAYDYVLNARKRYNSSNGQQGAFVVAVNCSWGITFGQPSEAPLWCAAFDSLGAAGILGVAATANMALDVDVAGDLPTACPSNYLISVTSLTNTDHKAANAAWGAQNIDLGAYGKDVYSAGANNSYNTYMGTSFAAPQVSGAIGLLYSASCSNLAAMAKANPAVAALWAKELLLQSVTPNNDLAGKTLTGGRLNLFSLLQNYQDQCAACLEPFAIQASGIGIQQATIRWSKVSSVQSVNLYWRQVGNTGWNLAPMVQSPHVLTGLEACTSYEISLRSNCGSGNLSDWSAPVVFTTDACCAPPATIGAGNITSNSATLNWNNLIAASGYRLRIRPANGVWTAYYSDVNSLTISDLSPCTDYQAQIQTLCGQEETPYSDTYTFRTSGCGACIDKNYCAAKGKAANDEWIARVEIGDWSHSSGGGYGYEDHTGMDMDSVLDLWPQTIVPVSLTPAFSGLAYKEYFRVYIDYNGDGFFSEPEELAFDPGFASEAQVNGVIEVPPAAAGDAFLTRMRILMKYKGPQDTPPTPCENFEFGQVEDYCVRVNNIVISTNQQAEHAPMRIFPQPAGDQVFIELPQRVRFPVNIMVHDAAGREIYSNYALSLPSPIRIDISGWPAGIYVVMLNDGRSVCQQKMLKIR